MRYKHRFLLVLAAILATTLAGAQDPPPRAPVRPVADTYFGQTVIDPYRWMEEAKSAELAAWMKAQSDYTRAVLDKRFPASGPKVDLESSVLPRAAFSLAR